MPHATFDQHRYPNDEQMLLQEIASRVFAAILEAREDGEEEVLILDEGLRRVLTHTLANWVLANHDERSALGEAAMRVSGRRPLNGLRGIIDDEMAAVRERMRGATYDFSGVSGGPTRQEQIRKLLFGDVDLTPFIQPGTDIKFNLKRDDPPDPPPPPDFTQGATP